MMQLNDNLITCIESTAASIWLCNVNARLETNIVRVMGARVEADRCHIIVYLPVMYSAGILNNLPVSTKLTFLTAIIYTYESYQVKGSYISHRECTEEEVAYQKAYMEGFTDALQKQGLPKDKGYKAYFRQPCVALRIAVEEVYEQTPKKGAGAKLAV